jgi:hypothetical protein
LAQPPDISETFLREVDENLRRDRMRDFAKRYGTWLIAAVVLFLAASGGWIYWQHYQQQRSEQQVEQLAQVYKDIGTGSTTGAAQQLDTLSNSGRKAVGASAKFVRAALALQQNDLKAATVRYRELANDDSLPQAYRDIALIRQTALEFDQIPPQEVISRLTPLAKPGTPWFGTAGEMTAMAMIKQGNKAEAGRLLAAIAKDRNVPEPIRDRTLQIAGSLGVDVSSALRAPAQ